MPLIEIVGYLGSVLIAVSLTMSNILKLRWINFFGASTFAVYGAIIGAYPVLVLNGYIAIVDIYYLVGMYRQHDYFKLTPADGPDDNYLRLFWNFYKDDIQKIFPKFDIDKYRNANFYFILRNLVPTGLFVYEEIEDETIHILLDYSLPDYRDLKNAKFIFFTTDFMNKRGYKRLVTESHRKIHDRYLKKIGFERVEENIFAKSV